MLLAIQNVTSKTPVVGIVILEYSSDYCLLGRRDFLYIYRIERKDCVLGHVRLFVTPWTVACQAFLPAGFSRQSIYGVGCHFQFQEIFLTQKSNPYLLHWQADSLPLSHLRSPKYKLLLFNNILLCIYY